MFIHSLHSFLFLLPSHTLCEKREVKKLLLKKISEAKKVENNARDVACRKVNKRLKLERERNCATHELDRYEEEN